LATSGKPWRAEPLRSGAASDDSTDPGSAPSGGAHKGGAAARPAPADVAVKGGAAARAAPGGAKGGGTARPVPPPADHEKTDPAAVMPDAPEEDVTGGFADGTVQEVDESAVSDGTGAEDETQVYDPVDEVGADPPPPAAGPPKGALFKLNVLAGPRAGSRFELERGEVTVGRGTDNRVSIPDVSVSRKHCRLVVQPDGSLHVSDLNSGNGVRVNGDRVANARLAHGDELALGDTVFQVLEVGAPAVKKGRPVRPAQNPTGATADPGAPTRGEMARVVVGGPRQGLATIHPRRKRLYAIFGIFGAFLLMLGVARKMHPPPAPEEEADVLDEAEPTPDSAAILDEAKKYAKAHRWADAARTFERALKYGDAEEITPLLEQAKREAQAQSAVSDAKKAMESGDFARVRKLAGSVPEAADAYDDARRLLASLPLAMDKAFEKAREAAKAGRRDEARGAVEKILLAEPAYEGARSLLAELDKADRKAAKKEEREAKKAAGPAHHAEPAHEAPAAAPPPPARPSGGNAALNAYLNGDLEAAVAAAENAGDQGMVKVLRLFRSNYIEGMRQAEANRAPEAVRTLGTAARADREIARERPSKLGREVRRALAEMEYQLGIEARGDEGLPNAGLHFRNALAANPDHELAKKQLDKVYQKARDLYMQAYIGKNTEPEQARRLFGIVVRTLPADEEFAIKAKAWYDRLGGAP